MTYLIIANWDANFRPDRVNWKDTEGEAQSLVDLLISKGDTNAFYIPTPSDDIMHVRVNPGNKSITIDASEVANRAAGEVQRKRRQAYQTEADPLFFEEQRGEVSAGTHAAKVAEIKLRFPK